MTRTFHIDDSSNKAQALLEFLRTLDFVYEEGEEKFALTKEHMEILSQRRNNRMEGKSETYSWEDVKGSLGEKKAG